MFDYQVLVVDDEESSRGATVLLMELHVPAENIHQADSIRTAQDILSKQRIDLALLDISMRQENGFQLAGWMNEHCPQVPFVFLTAHTQYALDGYRFHPMDFLLKPAGSRALEELLTRLQPVQAPKHATGHRIGIQYNGGFRLLDVDRVMYIEKTGRNVVAHLKGEDVSLSRCSLEYLELLLQEHGFVRVHKSFLVPIGAIEAVHADEYASSYEVCLKDTDRRIPLSRGKYPVVKEILQANRIVFL